MADIERQIDHLYKLSPAAFTAARNALAKTLSGEAAHRVKALRKPHAVAWSVNQVFWQARPVWDGLMKAGRALREAQIGALKGRKPDVRAATGAHREAVARAVKRAHELATTAGLNPNPDQLAGMLDAVSLAVNPPEDAGRFADLVKPAGFSALAGVTPVAAPAPSSRDVAKEKKAQDEARAKRQADARLDAANEALERVRATADAARRALNRAEADVAEAEREFAAAQAALDKLN